MLTLNDLLYGDLDRSSLWCASETFYVPVNYFFFEDEPVFFFEDYLLDSFL